MKPLAEALRSRIHAIFPGRFHIFRLQGPLAEGSLETFEVLVIGQDFLAYDANGLFFRGQAQVTELGTVLPPFVRNALKRFESASTDAVLVQRTLWFETKNKPSWHTLQTLIEAQIRHGGDVPAYVYSLGQNMRRPVRKSSEQGFTFRISTTSDDMKIFYNDMFVPLTLSRHGEKAHIPSFESMVAHGDKLKLMVVEKDARLIAADALLTSHYDNKITRWRAGAVSDIYADRNMMSNVNMALVHNLLAHAKEEGIPTVSLGLTVPSLTEGNFFFKRRWGASFLPAAGYPLCQVAFRTPKQVAFLEKRPLILLDETNDAQETVGFFGLLGASGQTDSSAKAVEDLLEKTSFANLKHALVMTDDPTVKEALNCTPAEKFPCTTEALLVGEVPQKRGDVRKNSGHAPGENAGLGKGMARNMSIMGLSLFITNILALAMKMYLPRKLGPELTGIFYFADSFSLMVFGFLPLGIGTYITRNVPKNPEHAKDFLWSVIIFQAFLSLLFLGSAYFYLSLFHHDAQAIGVTLVMGIYAAMNYFHGNIFKKVFTAIGDFSLAASADVVVKFSLVFSCLGVLYFSPNLYAIAACHVFSECVCFAILFNAARKKNLISPVFNPVLLKNIVVSSLPFFVVGALANVYTGLDTTMLQEMSNATEVGLYGSAVRLKGNFLLIVPIIYSTFMPMVSKVLGDNPRQAENFFRQILQWTLAMSFFLSMGVLVFADFLSNILYGSEFAKAHRATSFLAPIVALTYLNILFSMYLNLTTRGRGLVIVTLTSLGINAGLNVFFIPWGLARWGVGGGGVGASIATSISEIWVLVGLLYGARKVAASMRTVSAMLFAAVPLITLLYTYDSWANMPLLSRICYFAVAVPIYTFATGIIRPAELMSLIGVLRRRGQPAY